MTDKCYNCKMNGIFQHANNIELDIDLLMVKSILQQILIITGNKKNVLVQNLLNQLSMIKNECDSDTDYSDTDYSDTDDSDTDDGDTDDSDNILSIHP
jgi:hypothetical protein